jgi:hypothetical protein
VSVQLSNCRLGVRPTDADAVDAHGSPLSAQPGVVGPLLPGKRAEQDTGQWQLALDPSLWPVRVSDVVVADDGMEWIVVYSKLIQSPPLTAEEAGLGLDLDVAFIRVTGNQITPAGTEPTGSEFVGRVGSPDLPEVGFGSQPFGTTPFGGSA